MMQGRRGFLRALAALPVVAQEAAQQAVAGLSMTSNVHMSGFGQVAPGNVRGPDPWELAADHVRKLISSGQIPAWKREQTEMSARHRARYLEPDILSLRSVSGSAKHAMQMRREFTRVLAEEEAQARASSNWNKLIKSFGWQ